ncbi:MAG: class II aldolase/adducin family protein [Candidatus Zixiibacteriota bacterium]
MNYSAERNLMVEIGRRLYRDGFVPGTDGNLSCLVDNDKILITPSGSAKGLLDPDDLILVDSKGVLISGKGKPSSELLMHLFVYQSRTDIRACCHAHPPYATALTVLGRKLPGDVLPEAILSVGEIPLTDYAPPGTDAVPDSLKGLIDKHVAFMLRNHGVLTIGGDLEESFYRMETVEHFAKIFYIAQGAGEIVHLDNSEVERLMKIGEAIRQERKL